MHCHQGKSAEADYKRKTWPVGSCLGFWLAVHDGAHARPWPFPPWRHCRLTRAAGCAAGIGMPRLFFRPFMKSHIACLVDGRGSGQRCLLNWMGGSRCYGTRPTCCFRSSRPKNKREKSTSSTPLVLFALPRLDPTPATSVFHHCATASQPQQPPLPLSLPCIKTPPRPRRQGTRLPAPARLTDDTTPHRARKKQSKEPEACHPWRPWRPVSSCSSRWPPRSPAAQVRSLFPPSPAATFLLFPPVSWKSVLVVLLLSCAVLWLWE